MGNFIAGKLLKIILWSGYVPAGQAMFQLLELNNENFINQKVMNLAKLF